MLRLVLLLTLAVRLDFLSSSYLPVGTEDPTRTQRITLKQKTPNKQARIDHTSKRRREMKKFKTERMVGKRGTSRNENDMRHGRH